MTMLSRIGTIADSFLPAVAGFNINNATQTATLDTSNEDTDLGGIDFNGDGSRIFMYGGNTSTAYAYDLTTSYDLSTGSYANISSSVGNGFGGFSFGNDGLKLYLPQGSNGIVEYDLSPAYDITSATEANTAFPTDHSSSTTNFNISPDGTKIYVGADQELHQYTLTTAYDITSYSYDGNGIAREASGIVNVAFNDDGTVAFTKEGSTVRSYNLSTPYDITTSGTVQDTASSLTSGRGIRFNPDGTKMYLGGFQSIVEYDLT